MSVKIRPGLLVALRCRLQGGVTYERKDLERAQEGESARARWETERTIANAAEFEAASKLRSRVRGLVAGACVQTSFGLLCPTADESALNTAIDVARATTAEWNRTAEYTRVEVSVLKGRIAESDEEAGRAIADEIRGLLGEIGDALRDADPTRLRDAASRARAINVMLDDSASEKVAEAIATARKAARVMVQNAEAGTSELADRLAELMPEAYGAVNAARFALLDDSAPTPTDEVDALPAVDAARFSGLDSEPCPTAEELAERAMNNDWVSNETLAGGR